MRIDSKNVYLRPLELSDAEGNYPNWFNDQEVCKYNSHGENTYTKEMAIAYIKSVLDNPTCKVFAICDKKTDRHIGNISLQSISEKNRSAEFAIIMGEKDFWGKGCSKEAGRALIKYGFNTLNLHRIYCGTSEANIPMQRLALYLGMELEGVRKEAMYNNKHFYDVLEYGVLKKDINETM